ncbi:sensor histidine kinase [Embleya scabrispora]|uniref:sensor histidine kinase n=1 Tax=Embleya scabrispora TaxID=159449 RepID=UPI0003A661DF|nr:sensor histidine kinase [Embleya scabrispora]MYS79840.1 two-component sensor histidine kinase [Streptomyces sp. SID5474]
MSVEGPARVAVRGLPASANGSRPSESVEPWLLPVPKPLARWLPCRTWVGELLLVALVLLCVIGGSLGGSTRDHNPGHPNALNLVIAGITCLVLLGRLRWPLTVLALTEAGQVFYLAADGLDGPILIPTMVALYTVAASGQLRRSVLIASAVAVVHTGMRIGLTPDGFLSPEKYLSGIWMYLPVAIGEAVRAKRAYWAEVQARLARAEHEREDEARRRVTAERMRIARELHDVVAHSIAMINIQAGVAAHVIDRDVPQAKEALVHIKVASRDALAELRTTLGVLRQDGDNDLPTEPTPGVEDVDALVASYRNAGLPVLLEESGEARTPSAPVGLALYRIVQESLTNAMKHAGDGASAIVRVVYGEHAVEVDVLDDGRGSPKAKQGKRADGTGHGLLGMRERAVAVGGSLAAGPGPNGGFSVHAVLPHHKGALVARRDGDSS